MEKIDLTLRKHFWADHPTHPRPNSATFQDNVSYNYRYGYKDAQYSAHTITPIGDTTRNPIISSILADTRVPTLLHDQLVQSSSKFVDADAQYFASIENSCMRCGAYIAPINSHFHLCDNCNAEMKEERESFSCSTIV